MAIKVSGTEVISDDKRILNNESLPDIRPSLLLDFANSKTLDPRITFTRGSTATYWDGKTTAKAEENLFKYSQEFDNGYWSGLRSVRTANQTTAPDGTTTADAINQASGETSGGFINSDNNEGYTSGVTYTTSIYAKPNGKNFLRVMTTYANGTQTTWFNLSTGSVGTSSSDHTASMVDAGNGWYRCIVTATADSDGYINFYIAEADNTSSVTDDQTGYYAWGAQVEQRSSATAYTATTSSPIVKYQPVLQTAASGEARFDHDPVTGESKGLLIEEARTNLLTYSEAFDNAAWSKTNASISANSITAPDGTLTADRLYENTVNGQHVLFDSNSITANTAYTASGYFKASGRTRINFRLLSGSFNSGAYVTFDLSNGTVAYSELQGTGSNLSYSISDAGNGWYRCSVSCIVDATSTSAVWAAYLVSSGNTDLYTGDGYSGIFVWGAQLEEGSFPTSYIPTSGSTVTRVADGANMTGANLSSWFRQDEGTIYVNYGNANLGGNIIPDPYVVGFSGGTSATSNPSMRIRLEDTNNSAALQVLTASGDISANFGNYVPTDLTDVRITAAYGTDDFALSVSDSSFETDTSGNAATGITYLHLGHDNGALNGHIKKFAFYPKRLPNATLQAMTEA